MLDALFVVPYSKNLLQRPPIGSLLLATILRNNNISADIFLLSDQAEYSGFHTFVSEMVSAVLKKNAKIVSFYTRCDTYHIMLSMAQQIKQQTSATIVFAGPQADIVAQETLRAFPYVDYVCQGEGETTVVPLFSSILQGSTDHTVAGLVYRDNADIIQNPRPAFLENLDLLPEIDFSIVGIEGDCSHVERFPIDVGRGCPFCCSYCSTNTFWGRKYRLKTPECILREINSLNKKYGITSFSFSHDMFTFNRNQVIKLCQMFDSLDFKISWSCSARIDCIDKELIDIMSAAGMKWIFIGIETGSERMQKLIRKNLKLRYVIERLQYLHSKGVHVVTSFIHGFPDETPEDLSKTLSMIAEIAKLSGFIIQNHLCTFLPGTELSIRYANELVPASFFSDITSFSDIGECEELIHSYPDVFPQFMEYHTSLREKLEYFPLFTRLWTSVQPVYQYCSEKYEKERLIDMYFDFVKANQSFLEKSAKLSYESQLNFLSENDLFTRSLVPENLQDVVRDCYRMATIHHSLASKTTEQKTEIFCFSPKEFEPGSDITTYKKQLTIVNYTRSHNNRIEMSIKTPV